MGGLNSWIGCWGWFCIYPLEEPGTRGSNPETTNPNYPNCGLLPLSAVSKGWVTGTFYRKFRLRLFWGAISCRLFPVPRPFNRIQTHPISGSSRGGTLSVGCIPSAREVHHGWPWLAFAVIACDLQDPGNRLLKKEEEYLLSQLAISLRDSQTATRRANWVPFRSTLPFA